MTPLPHSSEARFVDGDVVIMSSVFSSIWLQDDLMIATHWHNTKPHLTLVIIPTIRFPGANLKIHCYQITFIFFITRTKRDRFKNAAHISTLCKSGLRFQKNWKNKLVDPSPNVRRSAGFTTARHRGQVLSLSNLKSKQLAVSQWKVKMIWECICWLKKN